MADASVKNAFNEYQALKSFGYTSPWFGGPDAAFTIHAGKEDKVFGLYNGVITSYEALKKMLRKADDDLAKLRRESSPAVTMLYAENAKLKAALRGAQEDLGETLVMLNYGIAENKALSERLVAIGKILDGDYEIE